MRSGRARPDEQDFADSCANLSQIYLNNLSDAETNLFWAGLVINILSSIITVIMNSMIIHILMNAFQARDIVHPILCSICGAGLFSGIAVQPLFAVNYYLDPKVFQYWSCNKILGIVFAASFYLTGYGVLASLALLSFYQLKAVSDPAVFRTRYTMKRTRKHVAYLWVSEVIISIGPQGIFWQDNRLADMVFYTGAGVLTVTIIVIQVWTFLSLKIHNRNMLRPETNSLQIALVVKRAKKMSKTSAMIFAALITLCLPVVIVAIITLVNARRDRLSHKLPTERDTTIKSLLINTQILTFLFPAVYPLILLFMNKALAKEAAKVSKKLNLCKKRSETLDITPVQPAAQVSYSRRAWTIPQQNVHVSLELPNDDVLRKARTNFQVVGLQEIAKIVQ